MEKISSNSGSTGLPRTGVFSEEINALKGIIFTFLLTLPPAYIFRK